MPPTSSTRTARGRTGGSPCPRSWRPHVYRSVMYVEEGDEVSALDGANKALGILFLRFDGVRQMEELLGAASRHVRVVYRGRRSMSIHSGTRGRTLVALHLLLAVFSLSGIMSKLAAQFPFMSTGFVLCYGGMIVVLGVYAIGWQQVIKRIPPHDSLRKPRSHRDMGHRLGRAPL